MSGHSKWAQIKRQKSVADARRGMLFTKLSQEITLAARQGGPNIETNPRLRLAVQKAKDYNMPWENIERAIKRASGEGVEGKLTEIVVEGYGRGGVAILVEAITNNRNRTVQELRTLFARNRGSLGESGCVSWLFNRKGVIQIDIDTAEEGEEIALKAIDAGAEDVKIEKRFVEIRTPPEDLEKVRGRLEKFYRIGSAEISLVPTSVVRLDGEEALSIIRFLDKLEEHVDINKIYSNADFPEEVLEQYRQSLT